LVLQEPAACLCEKDSSFYSWQGIEEMHAVNFMFGFSENRVLKHDFHEK
jgi:hypothetical protein